MPRFVLAVVTLAVAMLLGTGTSQAYEGPWCAVYPIGPGAVAERCEFQTFESCRQEITGGNRGFCNNNPRWSGRPGAQMSKRKVTHKRHRH